MLEQPSRRLMEHASVAPFGRGLDTLVNTDVRLAYQIDSSLVRLSPHTTAAIRNAVHAACSALGVDPVAYGVEPHLYKLLLYPPGGHFNIHRDTLKEEGMFATTVVQLPSLYTGGALVVHHDGRTNRVECDVRSDDFTHVTTFFAECAHELEAITSGFRLALVFNVVTTKQPQSISQLPYADWRSERVRDLVAQWEKDSEGPSKLLWQLKHNYTLDNLAFTSLLPEDRMLVEFLCGVRDAQGSDGALFSVHLALIEHGHLDNDPDFSGTSFKALKVVQVQGPEELVSLTLTSKHDLKEGALQLGKVQMARVEDTGNEGMKTRNFYHSGFVVVWPKSKSNAVIASQDLKDTMTWVKDHMDDECTPGVFQAFVDNLDDPDLFCFSIR